VLSCAFEPSFSTLKQVAQWGFCMTYVWDKQLAPLYCDQVITTLWAYHMLSDSPGLTLGTLDAPILWKVISFLAVPDPDSERHFSKVISDPDQLDYALRMVRWDGVMQSLVLMHGAGLLDPKARQKLQNLMEED